MNRRIDLTKLGGYPLAQEDLEWLQSSYRNMFAKLADFIGDMVIVMGCEDLGGGNISAGLISIDGELVPFQGGAIGTGEFIIDETVTPLVFNDGNSKDVLYERIAKFSVGGGYQFSDLVRTQKIIDMWQPGDIKQKKVDAAYIAANFDGSGYGINREKGWRIFTAEFPDAKGRVLVTIDDADATIDEPGKLVGSKTHTLTGAEQGSIKFKGKVDDISGGGATVVAVVNINGTDMPNNGGSNQSSYGTQITVRLNNDADPHSILQPSYAILTLYKIDTQ